MEEQKVDEKEDPLEMTDYIEQVRALVDLNADGQDPKSDLKPHEKPK
tara:strand:+ start:213 stop:353 length:141 start_codon:yes stop_codon:yes gene_type:complete